MTSLDEKIKSIILCLEVYGGPSEITIAFERDSLTGERTWTCIIEDDVGLQYGGSGDSMKEAVDKTYRSVVLDYPVEVDR